MEPRKQNRMENRTCKLENRNPKRNKMEHCSQKIERRKQNRMEHVMKLRAWNLEIGTQKTE
jgi:hypothetical protein